MIGQIQFDRIVCAVEVVREYLADPIPQVPAPPQTSNERRLVKEGVPRPRKKKEKKERRLITIGEVRDASDELFTQIEEIRAARPKYAEALDRLEDAERVELEGQFREQFPGNELNNLIRQGNSRIRRLKDIKRRIEAILDERDVPLGARAGVQRANVALPKLNLKNFDGNNIAWTEFWPLFESMVHLDQSLDEVQKMSYLDSILSGEAKKTMFEKMG